MRTSIEPHPTLEQLCDVHFGLTSANLRRNVLRHIRKCQECQNAYSKVTEAAQEVEEEMQFAEAVAYHPFKSTTPIPFELSVRLALMDRPISGVLGRLHYRSGPQKGKCLRPETLNAVRRVQRAAKRMESNEQYALSSRGICQEVLAVCSRAAEEIESSLASPVKRWEESDGTRLPQKGTQLAKDLPHAELSAIQVSILLERLPQRFVDDPKCVQTALEKIERTLAFLTDAVYALEQSQ